MILILGALLRNELIASKNPQLIVFCNFLENNPCDFDQI